MFIQGHHFISLFYDFKYQLTQNEKRNQKFVSLTIEKLGLKENFPGVCA